MVSKEVIRARISKESKEIIRGAASITGKNISEYMLSTTISKAKRDIAKHKKENEK